MYTSAVEPNFSVKDRRLFYTPEEKRHLFSFSWGDKNKNRVRSDHDSSYLKVKWRTALSPFHCWYSLLLQTFSTHTSFHINRTHLKFWSNHTIVLRHQMKKKTGEEIERLIVITIGWVGEEVQTFVHHVRHLKTHKGVIHFLGGSWEVQNVPAETNVVLLLNTF